MSNDGVSVAYLMPGMRDAVGVFACVMVIMMVA